MTIGNIEFTWKLYQPSRLSKVAALVDTRFESKRLAKACATYDLLMPLTFFRGAAAHLGCNEAHNP